jgi:HEAT repeat protein
MKKAILMILMAGLWLGAAEPYPVDRVSPGSLAETVANLDEGVVWVWWAVPLVEGSGPVCCSRSHRRLRIPGDGCELDGSRWGMTIHDHRLSPGESLVVYARLREGRVDRIRSYTSSCPVSSSDGMLVEVRDVSPEESVRFLEELVRSRGSQGDDALAAIALHSWPGATEALERVADVDLRHDLQSEAVFWLGSMRGEDGHGVLQRLIAQRPDADLLGEIAFALSESSAPEALDTLIGLAEGAESADARGQALFWLANRGGDRAAAAVIRAVSSDASSDVREEAVFALSQLPEGQGTEELLRIARSRSYDAAVRQQAIFWLVQSEDPRGEALLMELIAN